MSPQHHSARASHEGELPPIPARITGDVEVDVLRLDADLHLLAQGQKDRIAESDQRLRLARARLVDSSVHHHNPQRRAVAAAAEHALAEHDAATAMLEKIQKLALHLRTFVMTMREPPALLAEAVAGWSRSPRLPTEVCEYTEDDFLAADSHRAISPPSPVARASDLFGQGWRRDGDDPPGDVLRRAGAWQVGHIPQTGEIYAAHHGGPPHRRTIWLLGTGFTSQDAHELLASIAARRREPNSLILVAHVVAAAQRIPDLVRPAHVVEQVARLPANAVLSRVSVLQRLDERGVLAGVLVRE